VRGIEWVLGAMLVPLLGLLLDQWARLIWQRRTDARLIGQTIAYLHSAASEPDTNARVTMRTADFTDCKALLDQIVPCPPSGGLVAYDSMTQQQTKRIVSNPFPAFTFTRLRPVVDPISQ
jgi:hypothetical protein